MVKYPIKTLIVVWAFIYPVQHHVSKALWGEDFIQCEVFQAQPKGKKPEVGATYKPLYLSNHNPQPRSS